MVSSKSTRHCLVTGGAGFIGSHLSEQLLAAGHQVCAVDNFHLGRRENMAEFADHEHFDFVELDVRELVIVWRGAQRRRGGPLGHGGVCLTRSFVVHVRAALGPLSLWYR